MTTRCAAQRKYGAAFTFRNTALHLFTANETPTVGEVSSAYLARVRPFLFPHTFLGHEDPTLETELLTELPGILVRLVEALRRFDLRGGYADNDGSWAAALEFARRSDRVRLFLFETCDETDTGFVDKARLFSAFEVWVKANGRNALGKTRFYATVEAAGYRISVRDGVRRFAGIKLRPESEWGDPTESAESAEFSLPRFTREKVREEERERVVKGGWLKPALSALPGAAQEVIEV